MKEIDKWLSTFPLRRPIDLSVEDIKNSKDVENFKEIDNTIHFTCGYTNVSIDKSLLNK